MKKKKKTEIPRLKPEVVFNHMQHTASSLIEDYDIEEMTDILHTKGFIGGIKIISETTCTDEEAERVYALYGCNSEGRALTKKPFFKGTLAEVTEYLNDKSNAEDVLDFML